MLLEVYNQDFVRIDLIRTYEFVQYTSLFCGSGSFTLKIPVEEKSLKNLIYDNIILFETNVAGIINHRIQDFDESSYLTVSGILLNGILSYRSFLNQKKYVGNISLIVKQMVMDNFLNPTNGERKINFLFISENLPVSEKEYSKQVEETEVMVEVQNVLENESYGYEIVPVLNESSDLSGGNISGFKLEVKKPTNRTIRNLEGNVPVVFDSSLNNVQSATYDENGENLKNVFIVNGMENKTTGNRVSIEYKNSDSVGLKRKEMVINASNVRNMDEDGNQLSDLEYEDVLKQKALEYASNYKMLIYFDGTIPQRTIEKRFGVDFFLGDFVTFIDSVLGIEVDIQVTGFTKSLTRNGTIYDLLFGSEKLTLRELIKKGLA